MPDVLGESRWIVPECCLLAAVVQNVRPLFADDEFAGAFESDITEWNLYDIGPRDGSTIVAVAMFGDVSVAINGQTMFKDRPVNVSTIDLVQDVARSVRVESKQGS